MMLSFPYLFVSLLCLFGIVIESVIYEGIHHLDWWCRISDLVNNCNQTLEYVQGTGFGRCYSGGDKKGQSGLFPSPLNYQSLQLFHDDNMDYEYNIILGTSFHCPLHCHCYGPGLIGFGAGNSVNWESALNADWNMYPYTDILFYNVWSINATHIISKLYRGGTPNTATWTIDNYHTFYSDDVRVTNIDRNNTIFTHLLKYAHITLDLGDTKSSRESWVEVQYFAMNANFDYMHHENIPNVNDFIQYVDLSALAWQYPVSYGGYNDAIYKTFSGNAEYNFLNLTKARSDYPDKTIIGYGVDTYGISGTKYNYLRFGSENSLYFNDPGNNACWLSASILFNDLTSNYSKIRSYGSFTVYVRNFRWIFQDPTTSEPTSHTTTSTIFPSASPTHSTVNPSLDPTSDPTMEPTRHPSCDPTIFPSNNPTSTPSTEPTADPICDATEHPSSDPTSDPTMAQKGEDESLAPELEPTQIALFALFAGLLITVSIILCLCCKCSGSKTIWIQNPMVIAIAIGEYSKQKDTEDEALENQYLPDLDVSLDIENLSSLFVDSMNYTMYPRHLQTQWSQTDIVQLLETKAKELNDNIDSYDGLIVAISGHGLNKDCICSSDYKLMSKDAIHRLFSWPYPKVRNIPRIFMFDSCSGDGEYGKFMTQLNDSGKHFTVDDIAMNLDDDEYKEEPAKWERGTKNPDYKLVEISASNPGFQAKLSSSIGSYMIYGFVDEMRNDLNGCCKKSRSISEIFTKIQNDLEERGKQQIRPQYNNGTEFVKFKPYKGRRMQKDEDVEMVKFMSAQFESLETNS